jgi:hypothetical protein
MGSAALLARAAINMGQTRNHLLITVMGEGFDLARSRTKFETKGSIRVIRQEDMPSPPDVTEKGMLFALRTEIRVGSRGVVWSRVLLDSKWANT